MATQGKQAGGIADRGKTRPVEGACIVRMPGLALSIWPTLSKVRTELGRQARQATDGRSERAGVGRVTVQGRAVW